MPRGTSADWPLIAGSFPQCEMSLQWPITTIRGNAANGRFRGVKRTSTTETTSRHGRSRYWWVPTAVLSTHYNDLADAGGQLRSPEATTERATNAQILTGCTKCPIARSEATPSPAWVLPVRRSIHARGHGLRGRGALGGDELCV